MQKQIGVLTLAVLLVILAGWVAGVEKVEGDNPTTKPATTPTTQPKKDVSRIIAKYGGFEQDNLSAWKATDGRVKPRLNTEQPREGIQVLEMQWPKGESVYYGPGISIQPYWTWDTSKPAAIRFSVNARQRYLGYNLYARLDGVTDKGEPISFLFFALQNGAAWTHCRDGMKKWNPDKTFLAGVDGRSVFRKLKGQVYAEWMPGLTLGAWKAKENTWVDFTGSLSRAFEQPGAPERPKSIEFKYLEIRGSMPYETHYWLDAVSLGEE